MKKKLLLALASIMCISLCACGGSESTTSTNDSTTSNNSTTVETQDENYVNPFVIEAIYFCEAGCTDPASYGLTIDEYFERNPHLKEEALDNNDEICLFVFASLNSLESGKKNLILPKNTYDSSLPGDVLPLSLFIGEDFMYSTSYEFNDRNDKMSKYWDSYKSGSSLNDDYVLYEGSGDSQKIVGMFFVKYYDYKKAVEENKELTLKWDSYKATFNGSEIIKESCMEEISQHMAEIGLLQ